MPQYYAGLMSGTSLDGIDAVLADCDATPLRVAQTRFDIFAPDLRAELLALNAAGDNEIDRAARVGNQLARAYAATIGGLLRDAGIDAAAVTAIGCHGQTVRHRPDAGYTIQLVNAALLAELAGITVINDFRSRDIAAGGQGAPLVPAFHDAVFRDDSRHRVIVNIGGISNVTDLAPGRETFGFDCGPGNLLLDAWAGIYTGKSFDENGAWAAGGTVDEPLLERMLADEFFHRPPPKSTGREHFNSDWLERLGTGSLPPRDVQATLLELSARAITQSIGNHCGAPHEIYLCGGGAHNAALSGRIAALLPQYRVAPTDTLGIGADWVEACAFAWLACRTSKHEPGNLPAVTGARGSRVLGAIHPA
ncbi:MAG TPA: anhydro-N-acetylmuramic acid kinase [Burkholderiales bacterium]|nr:anhydro-N-acetylmuramic acid kinase [Burkholderiales bacterium]